MGFSNKFRNKMDNYKSKQNEKSDINDLKSQIDKERVNIDLQTLEIGNFYWNLYNQENSEYEPPEEARQFFESIVASVQTVEELEKAIKDREESGLEERRLNDEKTAELEAQEKQRKEEARMEREAQKAAKKAEKEGQKTASTEQSEDEDDELF